MEEPNIMKIRLLSIALCLAMLYKQPFIAVHSDT